MATWKVKDKKYTFPDSWGYKNVLNFVNQDFKICPYCGKVDIHLDHLNKCDETFNQRQARIDNYFN